MSGEPAEMCGALHPERPALGCERPAHQGVGFHRAQGVVWEADPLPDVRRRGKAHLAEIAARTRRPRQS